MSESAEQYGIDLYGPVAADPCWQAQQTPGFSTADFTIDWPPKIVVCPQGHQNTQWFERLDRRGREVVQITCAARDCSPCPVRSLCTHSAKQPRFLMLRPEPIYTKVPAARARQHPPAFKEDYAKRAGIEGTLSQGVRAFELRRSRYVGDAKTHFQHLMIAVALNIVRLFAWSEDRPREQTRCSRFATLSPAV